MVVLLIIIILSSLNIILHLVVKELRTTPGMIIVGICGTIIILSISVTITAVFQYLYRVNGNSVICAVFKYIPLSLGVIYTMLKVTYLFHFAYLMYRSYTLRPCKKESKKLLFLYGAVITTPGTLCSVVLIVIDLLHERTAFDTYNGYCANHFWNIGVSDKVLIAIIAILSVIEIVFFIIAITLYYLTTKRFCTCGSANVTGPSNIRVSITLIAAIGLGGLLLVILLLAGVAGESSVNAASVTIYMCGTSDFANCISNLKENPSKSYRML